MSLSMYQVSIPSLSHMLTSLSHILKKALLYAENKKIDPEVLVNARLAPDMFPLVKQIQIASDTAKGCAARLANIDIPSFPDTETTFAELHERVIKTISFLNSVTAAQIDGSEDRTIILKFPNKTLEFSGRTYLFDFVIPNFYFQLTTTYAILRHNGVDIGKMDFLGVTA